MTKDIESWVAKATQLSIASVLTLASRMSIRVYVASGTVFTEPTKHKAATAPSYPQIDWDQFNSVFGPIDAQQKVAYPVAQWLAGRRSLWRIKCKKIRWRGEDRWDI